MRYAIVYRQGSNTGTFTIDAGNTVFAMAMGKKACSKAALNYMGCRYAQPTDNKTLRDILEFENVKPAGPEVQAALIDMQIDDALARRDYAALEELHRRKYKTREDDTNERTDESVDASGSDDQTS